MLLSNRINNFSLHPLFCLKQLKFELSSENPNVTFFPEMDWCVRLTLLATFLLNLSPPLVKGTRQKNKQITHHSYRITFFLIPAQWDTPALSDPENEYVDFSIFESANDYAFIIAMDEELQPPITIAKLNYNGI